MTRVRLYGWLIIVFASLTILFGELWHEERRRVVAYRDASACWQIVHEQGAAYSDVIVGVTSHPMAVVGGAVASEAERKRLDHVLSERLGGGLRSRVRFVVRVDEDAPSTTRAAGQR